MPPNLKEDEKKYVNEVAIQIVLSLTLNNFVWTLLQKLEYMPVGYSRK